MKRHHVEMSMKRKRKMDAVLDELGKQMQQHTSDNQHIVSRTSGPKKYDTSTTTNLFVKNLSPTVTESDLIEVFERFGEDY